MNYNESTQTGDVTTWRRCYTINVINPYRQTPAIQFHEEDITSLPDGRTTVVNNTSCAADMSAPNTQFNLIHPETGAVIGTATYQEVYVMLFSLYMDTAIKRDNYVPPVPLDEIPA